MGRRGKLDKQWCQSNLTKTWSGSMRCGQGLEGTDRAQGTEQPQSLYLSLVSLLPTYTVVSVKHPVFLPSLRPLLLLCPTHFSRHAPLLLCELRAQASIYLTYLGLRSLSSMLSGGTGIGVGETALKKSSNQALLQAPPSQHESLLGFCHLCPCESHCPNRTPLRLHGTWHTGSTQKVEKGALEEIGTLSARFWPPWGGGQGIWLCPHPVGYRQVSCL